MEYAIDAGSCSARASTLAISVFNEIVGGSVATTAATARPALPLSQCADISRPLASTASMLARSSGVGSGDGSRERQEESMQARSRTSGNPKGNLILHTAMEHIPSIPRGVNHAEL